MLEFLKKADKGLGIILRWGAGFAGVSMVLSLVASKVTVLGNLNFAESIFVGIFSTMAIILFLSIGAFAWRALFPIKTPTPINKSIEPEPTFDLPNSPRSEPVKRLITVAEKERIIDTSKLIHSTASNAKDCASDAFLKADVRIHDEIDLEESLDTLKDATAQLKASAQAIKAIYTQSSDCEELADIIGPVFWAIDGGHDSLYTQLVSYQKLIEALIENGARPNLVYQALVSPRDAIHSTEQQVFERLNEVSENIEKFRTK
ncbi:MAG: hypothetical protein COA85_11360 [Robiginitomaculum sp.]|nr:MAG: hypothetical protein COA85_11360 [Robiginitomaculum sp.]